MQVTQDPGIGPYDATGRFVRCYDVRGTAEELVALYEWLRDEGPCADHREHRAARGYFVGGDGSFDLRRWCEGLARLTFEREGAEERFRARWVDEPELEPVSGYRR